MKNPPRLTRRVIRIYLEVSFNFHSWCRSGTKTRATAPPVPLYLVNMLLTIQPLGTLSREEEKLDSEPFSFGIPSHMIFLRY